MQAPATQVRSRSAEGSVIISSDDDVEEAEVDDSGCEPSLVYRFRCPQRIRARSMYAVTVRRISSLGPFPTAVSVGEHKAALSDHCQCS